MSFFYADTSKSLYKLYHKSHFALAGLVPVTAASPTDSFPAKLTDVALSVVIPFHSHVSLNSGECSIPRLLVMRQWDCRSTESLKLNRVMQPWG